MRGKFLYRQIRAIFMQLNVFFLPGAWHVFHTYCHSCDGVSAQPDAASETFPKISSNGPIKMSSRGNPYLMKEPSIPIQGLTSSVGTLVSPTEITSSLGFFAKIKRL